jgi:hypothetical protein
MLCGLDGAEFTASSSEIFSFWSTSTKALNQLNGPSPAVAVGICGEMRAIRVCRMGSLEWRGGKGSEP